MIMVDELIKYPNRWGPFIRGSCHLTTDGPIEELHAFAERLGLKREWFQNHVRMPHYDLHAKTRAKALQLGAIEVPWREQARRRRARRAEATP